MDMLLTNAARIIEFVHAGHAVFTLTSTKTGTSFTYKVSKKEGEEQFYFVALLSGPNNDSDYQFLGTLRLGSEGLVYHHGFRSKVGAQAPSALAFSWFYAHLSDGELPSTVEFRHCGRCGRCGRQLTTPESIDRGLGPDCASKC